MRDILDDLREAAQNALRGAELNVRIAGDGTSGASVSLHRERLWLTLAIVAVVAFLIGRALK